MEVWRLQDSVRLAATACRAGHESHEGDESNETHESHQCEKESQCQPLSIRPADLPRGTLFGTFRLWTGLGMFRPSTLLGMFRPIPSHKASQKLSAAPIDGRVDGIDQGFRMWRAGRRCRPGVMGGFMVSDGARRAGRRC